MAETEGHPVDRTEPYPGELDQAWKRLYQLEIQVRVIGETAIITLSVVVGVLVGIACFLVPTNSPFPLIKIGVDAVFAVLAGVFCHAHFMRKFRTGW